MSTTPHLVEVEDEVQLAHVAEVVVEDLHKQVDCFQAGQLIVGGINAHGEEQARIAPVHDLVGPELCAAKARKRRSSGAPWV